jgi:hypothetical protein
MKTHIEVVGLINIVSGILTILIGAIIFAVLLLVIPATNDPEGRIVLPVLASIAGFVTLLFGIPSIVAGAGLLRFKPWARILTLILSILALLNIPVGTITGAYSIWVLTHQESLALLRD